MGECGSSGHTRQSEADTDAEDERENPPLEPRSCHSGDAGLASALNFTGDPKCRCRSPADALAEKISLYEAHAVAAPRAARD